MFEWPSSAVVAALLERCGPLQPKLPHGFLLKLGNPSFPLLESLGPSLSERCGCLQPKLSHGFLFLAEQLPHCLYWYFGIDTPLSSVRGSLLPKLCYFRYDVSGVLLLCKKSPRTS